MSRASVPGRREIVVILARVADRGPEAVSERLDSLELARLVYEVEQAYGVQLDLTDEQFARMSTVSGAAEVLGEAMAGTVDG